MNSQNNNTCVNQLFQHAQADGALSPQTLQMLENIDIGSQIQSGLGVSVDDVHASEVVLVTMMVDDSGSIRFSGNAQTVRDGHNTVLDALLASKQGGGMLVHTSYLNGFVLYPFLPLGVIDGMERQKSGKIRYERNPQVVNMNGKNYDPSLGTPLYDAAVVLLGRVFAKYQEFADQGVVARTVTLLITDGADESSARARASHVKLLVDDLIGEHHIVAGMGIDNGTTDFRQVFREMGIRDEWILTPKNSAGEIRRAFQVFSQSALRASQCGAAFSGVAANGFLATP